MLYNDRYEIICTDFLNTKIITSQFEVFKIKINYVKSKTNQKTIY